MAIFHGSQNKYEVNNKQLSKVVGLIWLGIFFIIYGVVLYLWISHIFSIINFLVVGLLFSPILWFIHSEINKWVWEYSSYRKGLKGAGAIWYELHKLPNDYHVYQHCVLPGRIDDIDFIIVGPPGIFVVEVKSHSGHIEFDGVSLKHNGEKFEKDFIYQVKTQYQSLHHYLIQETGIDTYIHPIIVFSNRHAQLRFGKEKIHYIQIAKKSWLIKTIFDYQWYRFAQEKLVINTAIAKLVTSSNN